jgi:hypothetical protein
MKDGSLLRFVWNQSGEWQNISFTVDTSFKNIYWLDPETGNIVTASGSHQNVSQVLPPYGSAILYTTNKEISSKLLNAPSSITGDAKEVLKIEKWNIRADTAMIKNSSLFDWRDNPDFKYASAECSYTASFNLIK